MKQLFSKDQRGTAHAGLIVAIVVLVIAAGLGWFIYTKNKDDKPKTGTADKAVQEAVKNAKCHYTDTDLCKFFTGWKAEKHYAVTATHEADGKKTATLMNVDGDDRYSLKVAGDTPYEIITLGTSNYVKAADGTWYKQNVPQAQADKYKAEADFDYPEPETNGTKITYKKIGKEACDELMCFKYQMIDPNDVATTNYIWFDDQDYQLRRSQTSNQAMKYDATFSYKVAAVTEPSPVKDLQPNQSFVLGATAPTTLPATGDVGGVEDFISSYQ